MAIPTTPKTIDPIVIGRTSFYLLSALLFAATLGIYWRTLKYPYIQDDWIVMNSIATLGPLNAVKAAFLAFDAAIYRPLATLYMSVVYTLYGTDATGFHLLAMFVHFANSMLVALIVSSLTLDSLVSWCAAFLYMAAAAVHIDPLLWMIGISNLGGTFFFLLTVYLFIEGGIVASIVTFVFALLTTDATVVLPAILFLMALPIDKKERWHISPILQLLPHLLLAIVFVKMREKPFLQMAVDAHHVYGTDITLRKLFPVLTTYVDWSVNTVVPTFGFPLISIGLSALGFALALFYCLKSGISLKKLFLFGGWYLVGLLPALFVPSHAYRYYLSFALPAFFVNLVYAISGALLLSRAKEKFVTLAPAAAAALVFASAVYVVTTLDAAGKYSSGMPGSHNLMVKGKYVEPIQDYLKRSYPSPSAYTTFIFDGIPASTFGGSAGPRIWFGDSTIHVYESSGTLPHAELSDPMHPDSAGRAWLTFDPRKTFVVYPDQETLGSYKYTDRFPFNPFASK